MKNREALYGGPSGWARERNPSEESMTMNIAAELAPFPPPRISKLIPVPADEWERIYRDCDYATFFHSPAWSNIWRLYSDGEIVPESKLAVFSDGARAVIVLSVNKSHAAPARWKYVSSSAGTYGGWISIDALTQGHGRLLQDILLSRHNLVWRINPYDPIAPELERPSQIKEETHVIDLRKGMDHLYRTWRHKSGAMLYSVKKANKAGLRTRQADSINDWRAYFGLYEKSLERWGAAASSRYNWKLFELLSREPGSAVRLWLVEDKGRAVAGAVVLYSKRHAVYWSGAADADWFHLRPVNLMFHDIITGLFDKNYWWFDFNPSGGHKSVAEFKRRCGGEPAICRVVKIKGR